ncbi:MAG TPA: hypothetical protein VD837_07730 [Terriglobales bacterium]|nr:hypothetical protein [Terriglobales bacterium]
MRRFAFRRLLPLLNVVVYLVLIYAGFAGDLRSVFQRRLESYSSQGVVLVNAAWQEGGDVGWNPEYVCYWVPKEHELAYTINLPASVSGGVVGGALWRGLKLWKLDWGVFWSEAVFIAVWTLAFVPVFWFFAGRWVDRQVGILPPVRFRQTRTARILRIASASVSGVLLVGYICLATYAMVLARDLDVFEPTAMGWLFWLVFITVVTTSNLRSAIQQLVTAR